MLPLTARRVAENTSVRTNARIRRRIEESVIHHARHPEMIEARLHQLDREWDIERILEVAASSASLAGFAMAIARRDRRWLLLPMGVSAFLLQHALQGWCPPVPVLRRLGVRTAAEIDTERYALKALRGDFARDADRPGSFRQLAQRAVDAATA